VVLAIGIITSVFTGVTFTRLMVADYLRRNRPQTLNL
jgi:preprotein translocase subunit SecD